MRRNSRSSSSFPRKYTDSATPQEEAAIGAGLLVTLKQLEEIIWNTPGDVWLAPARSKVELYEGILDILVQFHDRSAIPTAEAIVWR